MEGQVVYEHPMIYIGGAWVEPAVAERIEIHNPSTGTVCGFAPSCTPTDVDHAVGAARGALAGWSAMPMSDRAKLVGRMGEEIAARTEELAAAISTEVGTPINLCRIVQVGVPSMVAMQTSEVANTVEWEERIGNSIVVREAVGVVAAITPWNYPLHQLVAKVAPALVAGCTIVAKPAELAPTAAFILTEILDELGLPAGVFNLVSGIGATVGEALVTHPDVDMISFTGSTRAGKRITERASESLKRVSLELGGKSADILLNDLDAALLETAVQRTLGMCFLNNGQFCLAWSRMLIPRSRQAEIEDRLIAAAAEFAVGDAFAPTTKLGPLVSEEQRDRVLEYVRIGQAEGARLLCGGEAARSEGGYFVPATVFTDVDNSMRIAQEEIFGPVLCVIPYDDSGEDGGITEAVRIANDSLYGLSGAVWSADTERAASVARQLRTGQIVINGGMWNHAAPFGGYKQSGNGRELGKYGIEEFTELKALHMP